MIPAAPPLLLRRVFQALLCVALVAAPASAQSFKWWQSDKFQRDLGLSTDQIARLDGIFQASMPALRTNKEALDRLERELSRLVADGSIDETLVVAQVDRVEAVRSELSRTRVLMLVRMRRILTPDQRVKLTALHESWEREHPPRGSRR